MRHLNNIGFDWLCERVDKITDRVRRITPSEYNEAHRYLPSSVTSKPGYMRYSNSPWLREMVDCFDVDSPIREVNLKKGVQIGYSTLLESILLYYMGHVKTVPSMYVTADKELAKARLDNNIIPMIQQSDMSHIIRSSDERNKNKKGLTSDHIQWEGGGYCVPFGAMNANKMRSFSILLMLKDEIDGWPLTVGKDGNPDKLTDDRTAGYHDVRKIFRGSTPLIKSTSFIEKNYLRGDQRKPYIRCLSCSFQQVLRWEGVNKDTGAVFGFDWETEQGSLLLESVCYRCSNCGHKHYDYDKELLFSPDYGAEWLPTARPENPYIRSYHLPAFYSPQPWDRHVTTYINAYNREEKRVRDMGALQVFYNNVLAEPFEVQGERVTFVTVSGHRRTNYSYGQIPNDYSIAVCGKHILMLVCCVDVQKSNLAVAVFGFTVSARSFLIDYWRFEDDDCSQLTSPSWQRLREVIENKRYTDSDGREYWIGITLIDSGYSNDTVVQFCSAYASNVYPIIGRDRSAKSQKIVEFGEFITQIGTVGYRIVVDHYKERNASVLRRVWQPVSGDEQPEYHFNAPVNATDSQLKELTVETRREKRDENTGAISYYWHRPSGADNELWDLFNYASASVEIAAWIICVKHFELPEINWPRFWDYIEKQQMFYRESTK